ncbi:MAG TPA: hypothetical protein VM899_16855 [Rubellimicrobium sp.]|nr:hypothetical protein [Rubellimicrobium sp.]
MAVQGDTLGWGAGELHIRRWVPAGAQAFRQGCQAGVARVDVAGE